MSLVIIGFSHKTANAELRSRVAFSKDALSEALRRLISDRDVEDAVILSTCNRMEFYLNIRQPLDAPRRVVEFISNFFGLNEKETQTMSDAVYFYQEMDMVRHLFEVVSSLDSMVLGEDQILSQVRQAFDKSREADSSNEVFKQLFRQAIMVGKRVRTQTAIGDNPVSVSTAAIEMVMRHVDNFTSSKTLILGAGEMSKLSAFYVGQRGVKDITIVNRSVENAQKIATEMNCSVAPMSELPHLISNADLVICATSAPGFVVTPEVLSGRGASAHKLTILDLAIPVDVDMACDEMEGVEVLGLDALDEHIEHNKASRIREAGVATMIVEQEVDTFSIWMQERQVVPTISAMVKKMENYVPREVEQAARRFEAEKGAPLTDVERDILNSLALAVGNKILHGPIIRLRKQAPNPEAYAYTSAARYLFGLDSNPLGKNCRSCKRFTECRERREGCLIAKRDGYGSMDGLPEIEKFESSSCPEHDLMINMAENIARCTDAEHVAAAYEGIDR